MISFELRERNRVCVPCTSSAPSTSWRPCVNSGDELDGKQRGERGVPVWERAGLRALHGVIYIGARDVSFEGYHGEVLQPLMVFRGVILLF